MAAIIEPHRLPLTVPVRPELRLLPGGRRPAPAGGGTRIAPAAVVLALLAVVVVMALAVAVGRGALAGLAPQAPTAAAAPAASATGTEVVVRPGDTLWSIARRLQPTGDVRALVDRLAASAGTTTIQPGQRILVP
jgi:LysM repeat protein